MSKLNMFLGLDEEERERLAIRLKAQDELKRRRVFLASWSEVREDKRPPVHYFRRKRRHKLKD